MMSVKTETSRSHISYSNLVLYFAFFLLTPGFVASQGLSDSLAKFNSDSLKLLYLTNLANEKIYNNPEETVEIAHIFDSIAVNNGKKEYIVKAAVIRGLSHYVNQEYDKSLKAYVEALQLEDYITLNSEKARLYNNIATVYQIQKNPEKSIEYYSKALHQYETIPDSAGMANISSNLGLLYVTKNMLDKAEPLLIEAINYYNLQELSIYEGYTLLSLGNLQNQKEEYREAIKTYERTLELVPLSVNPLVSAAASNGLGVAYLNLGNSKLAEKHLKHGLQLAREYNFAEQEVESLFEFSEYYSSKNQFAKAYRFHKDYAALKDSIFTAEQNAEMVDAMTRYETEKKEHQIAILDAENILTKERLSTARKQYTILGIGTLLLAALLLWVFRLNRKLSAAISDKNILLKEIHHRVKNNLQVISALLSLQSNYVKDDVAADALRRGQDRVESMALIHKHLYQNDNMKGVNALDYFERLTDHLLSSYKLNNQHIELDLNIANVILDVDTMIPLGLIVNELISNCLKHAFGAGEKGVISISLRESGKNLILEVADDGRGIQDSKSKTKSFGQSLIKSLAKRLEADISYKTDRGYQVKLNIKEYQKSA